MIDYECLDRSRQNVISCPGNILLSGEFSIDDLVYVAGLLPGQFVDWVPKVVEVQGEGNKTGCPGFSYVCTRNDELFTLLSLLFSVSTPVFCIPKIEFICR